MELRKVFAVDWRVCASCFLLLGAFPEPAVAQSCLVRRISLDQNGQELAWDSLFPSVSSDGRLVTFTTEGPLLPSDTNLQHDIYLLDGQTGLYELVSTTPQGTAGNNQSFEPASISDDGRMLAFTSNAQDILPGLSNMSHAFVRDRATGTTRLVSVSTSGVEADGVSARISADGKHVAFVSASNMLFPGDTNQRFDVFVHRIQTGTTELVSITPTGTVGNGDSNMCDISQNGRIVVFASRATNLVLGFTPSFIEIYVRDRTSGSTSVVSVGLNGAPSNGHAGAFDCSEDGNFVAFESSASNLVPGDTNGLADIFVRDIRTGRIDRVNVDSTGTECNGWSNGPSISPDGRFVGFSSLASNLVSGDVNGAWDIFLYDRGTSRQERVSVGFGGIESNADSNSVSVSRNASQVVYHSLGGTLVPGDNNGTRDVFRRTDSQPTAYCSAKLNSIGCLPQIASTGIPSASASTGFTVRATNVRNQKAGLLLYGISGRSNAPFQGGTLCVKTPIKRTPGTQSGGSPLPASDCSGSYAIDMNAFAQGAMGGTPLPDLTIPGTFVVCQWWGRDPGFPPPNNSTLSAAIEFLVCD